MKERSYIAIDLKSFFASVECVERGLNPITTHLVVADENRTEKTICLAVSPALKAYGIPGRARLFEVVERVKQINLERQASAPGRTFRGTSHSAEELRVHSELALDYIAAPPRMTYYMRYSSRIYQIYLKYVAAEDIHVYSIDEVFIDATHYLRTYGKTARELAAQMIGEVLHETGIIATAGVGSNLYLAKVAMDILAKHAVPDENGVRMAELTEQSYREQLWSHRPLTDFWRVGRGYAQKLEARGLYTMGDIARCSVGRPGEFYNEELLYRLFGINAELLIDHAWGWEPCTIADIHAFRPSTNSSSSGQVLQSPYPFARARLVAREMTERLTLDLVLHGLQTDQLDLVVIYDVENLRDPARRTKYRGEIVRDHYGRATPKPAHGTENLGEFTTSTRAMDAAVTQLFDRVVDSTLLVRKIYVTANHVRAASAPQEKPEYEQMNWFDGDRAATEAETQTENAREQRMQQAILAIQNKYGKNAILKGMDLEEGATAMLRNGQIGGHKA